MTASPGVHWRNVSCALETDSPAHSRIDQTSLCSIRPRRRFGGRLMRPGRRSVFRTHGKTWLQFWLQFTTVRLMSAEFSYPGQDGCELP